MRRVFLREVPRRNGGTVFGPAPIRVVKVPMCPSSTSAAKTSLMMSEVIAPYTGVRPASSRASRVRAARQQGLQHVRISDAPGRMQRRLPPLITRLDGGPGRQQNLDHSRIVVRNSSMQKRGTGFIPCHSIGAGCQQDRNRDRILVEGRVMERRRLVDVPCIYIRAGCQQSLGHSRIEVPPVSWTPNPLGEWRTRCQEQDELIHPSFASR